MLRQVSLLRNRVSGLAATRPTILLGGPAGRSGLARLPPQHQPITTDMSLGAFNATPLRFSSPRAYNPTLEGGNMWVKNITKTAQEVQTSLSDMFRQAVWQMGSTLKKRRAKMNKHKLRKRRKLARRKSK
eukprot:scaffold7479_cov119-Amphora_coffeaeformis.AAC.2